MVVDIGVRMDKRKGVLQLGLVSRKKEKKPTKSPNLNMASKLVTHGLFWRTLFVLVSSGQLLLTSCQGSYFGSLSSRDGEMSYVAALAKWQA